MKKTLKDLYNEIESLKKDYYDGKILDEYGHTAFDIYEAFREFEKQDFSYLEDYEKTLLKSYIHYLCIKDDGCY